VKKRRMPRASLAANINGLMERRNWVQHDLAKAAGIAQRTVSNLCNPDGPSPKLDIVDAVAAAFGLEGWHLILPNLLTDLDGESSVAKLVADFESADKSGKRHVLRVAEREAEYKAAAGHDSDR